MTVAVERDLDEVAAGIAGWLSTVAASTTSC